MALVIDIVMQSPGGTDLFTSTGPGGPSGFYRVLGFEPTAEWFDGEEVFRLPLRPGT